MTEESKRALKLFKDAQDGKNIEEISEIFRYCCPRRYNKTKGKDRSIYDSSPIDAVSKRASYLCGQIFPPFREWIEPEPAVILDESETKSWGEWQADAKRKLHKALEVSNFHTEVFDAITDSLIAEGALLLHEGTARNPFVFECVDWDSFFSLESFDKRPKNNFLLRGLTVKKMEYLWKGIEIPDDMTNTGNEDSTYEIMDCVLWDDKEKKYIYEVWDIGKSRLLFKKDDAGRSPWIIFKFFKQMKTYTGTGPAADSFPDVKTSNKVIELLLKNGALAIGGMWQADDDGVINPANIKLVPGTIIPKSPTSKGLTPLECPIKLDVTQFILSEMKTNIKQQIQGASMPDPNQGIRSVFELSERKAETLRSEVPNTLRISSSIDTLVNGMYDILTSDNMKDSPYYIKPFEGMSNGAKKVIDIKAANPLIKLQEEVDFQSSLQAIDNLIKLFGPEAVLDLINVDEFAKQLLQRNNFDPKLILSQEKTAERRKARAEAQAAAAAAESEGKNGR